MYPSPSSMRYESYLKTFCKANNISLNQDYSSTGLHVFENNELLYHDHVEWQSLLIALFDEIPNFNCFSTMKSVLNTFKKYSTITHQHYKINTKYDSFHYNIGMRKDFKSIKDIEYYELINNIPYGLDNFCRLIFRVYFDKKDAEYCLNPARRSYETHVDANIHVNIQDLNGFVIPMMSQHHQEISSFLGANVSMIDQSIVDVIDMSIF